MASRLPAGLAGRDDSAESSTAKRLFQTIQQREHFSPVPSGIACWALNVMKGLSVTGRPGAAQAPDVLRGALANMASHQGHARLVDMGSVYVEGHALEAAQQALSEAITACQQSGMRTLVFGGGHETARAHGRGVLDAFPNDRIAVINWMRTSIYARLNGQRPARRSASWRTTARLSLGCFTTPLG